MRTSGGFGMRWYTVKSFGDMSLKVDFRDARTQPGYSNGGVLVRFPDPRTPAAQTPAAWSYDWAGAGGPFPPAKHYQSDPAATDLGLQTSCQRAIPSLIPADWAPAWIPVVCGEEIQINDSPDGGDLDPRKTGSVYGFADLDSVRSRPTPPGVWNDLEIRVVGQHYTVIRNGAVINEYENVPGVPFPGRPNDPGSSSRGLVGYLGLQAHGGPQDVVSFRDIRVLDLSDRD